MKKYWSFWVIVGLIALLAGTWKWNGGRVERLRFAALNARIGRCLFANGRWIAVGGNGAIFSSSDGRNWQMVHFGTDQDSLFDVAFGNGRWVAVGGATTFTSTDGMAWERLDSITPRGYRPLSIKFVDGLWVVRQMGPPYISRDGIHWLVAPPGPREFLAVDMAEANGLSVKVGPGLIATSQDNKSWTQRIPKNALGEEFYSVRYENGKWLALEQLRGIATSEDGITWTYKPGNIPNLYSYYHAFGNGRWVAYGGPIYSSENGLNWAVATGISPYPHADVIKFGNGRFVGIGVNIITSVDGSSWTTVASAPPMSYFGSLTYDQGLWVATGPGIAISEDGIHWRMLRRERHQGDEARSGYYSPGANLPTIKEESLVKSQQGQ
jgi:hypothetical protein